MGLAQFQDWEFGLMVIGVKKETGKGVSRGVYGVA